MAIPMYCDVTFTVRNRTAGTSAVLLTINVYRDGVPGKGRAYDLVGQRRMGIEMAPREIRTLHESIGVGRGEVKVDVSARKRKPK